MRLRTLLISAAFVAAGGCAVLGLAVSQAAADPAPLHQRDGFAPPPIAPVPPVPPLAFAPPDPPLPPIPPVPPAPPMPPSLDETLLPNVGETLAAYSQRMKASGVEVKAEAGRISLHRDQGQRGVWVMNFDMSAAGVSGRGFGQAFRDRVAEIERRAAEHYAEGMRRRDEAVKRRDELMQQRTALLEERRRGRDAGFDAQRRAVEAERRALEAERRALEAERRAFEEERRRARDQ